MQRKLLDVIVPLDAARLHIVIAENKSFSLSVPNDSHSNFKASIISEFDAHVFSLYLVERKSGKLPHITLQKEHFIEGITS